MDEDDDPDVRAIEEELDHPRQEPLPLAVEYHVSHEVYGAKIPLKGFLKGFGLCGSGGTRYVPYQVVPRTNCLDEDTLDAIRMIAANHRVYHSAVAARLVERRYSIPAPSDFTDTRIMAGLLEYPLELKNLIATCFKPMKGFPSRRHRWRSREYSQVMMALEAHGTQDASLSPRTRNQSGD
jgi:hypothetical protein